MNSAKPSFESELFVQDWSAWSDFGETYEDHPTVILKRKLEDKLEDMRQMS